MVLPKKWHGSVPQRARSRVIQLAKLAYSEDICREKLKIEQRMDPYLRPLIYYLEHRVLPHNKGLARRIQNQEDRYVLVGCKFYIDTQSTTLP